MIGLTGYRVSHSIKDLLVTPPTTLETTKLPPGISSTHHLGCVIPWPGRQQGAFVLTNLESRVIEPGFLVGNFERGTLQK